MKTTLRQLIVIFFILSYNLSSAQIYDVKKGSPLYVFAVNGINMRQEPQRDGTIIKKLLLGETLTFEGHTESYDVIENRKGSWIKVKNGKETGFVFSGFLSKFKPPKSMNQVSYNQLFADWLSTTVSGDALLHSGERMHNGMDEDGKDSYGLEWQYYDSGTIINTHIGYEWASYSIESFDININDVINCLDWIKNEMVKNKLQTPVSYKISESYPNILLVSNLANVEVILVGNKITISVDLYES